MKSFAIGVTIGGAVSPALGQAFSRVKQSTAELATNMRNTSAQLKAAQAFNKYKTTLEQLKVKQAELGRESPRLSAGIAEVEKRFEKAQKQLQKYGIAAKDAQQAEIQLGAQLAKTSEQIKAKNTFTANRQTRQSLHGEILGTVGLAYAAIAPMRTAIGFEQSVAKLGAITQATKSELDTLSKTARDLGAATQFSASQSAEAMTFLGMAGFKTNQIIEATPGMLSLAAAAGADLAQTADIASNILSGFNLQASEMGRVGDVLAKTFTSSNTNLAMLGETMKYVAPVAASVSASIEDVAAMTGMLGNVGIQGSNAGTALRTAFLRLVKPPKEAQAAMDALGISISDVNGKMKSMPSILAEIAKATNGMADTERMALVTQMFGTEAASAMAELIKQAGNGSLQAYSEQIKGAHGLTKQMADQMSSTTQGALMRLGSALESVAISIGSTILPALASIADGAAWLAGGFAKLAEKLPWLTQGIVGLTVGLIAGKVAFLGYRYAATLASDVLTGIKVLMPMASSATSFLTTKVNLATVAYGRLAASMKAASLAAQGSIIQKGVWGAAKSAATSFAVTAVTAIRAVGIAIATNPIGLLVTAIIGAGFLIYKYWQPISAFFSGMWEGIKQGLAPTIAEFKAFAEMFDPIFSPIGAIFSWVGEKISGLFEPVQSSSAELQEFASTGQKVGQILGSAFNALLHPLDTIWGLLQKIGSGIKELAASAIGKAWQKVNGAWVDVKSLFTTDEQAQPSQVIAGRVIGSQAAEVVPSNRQAQPSQGLRNEIVPPPAMIASQGQPPSRVINNTPQFNITQLPGEDSETLARRIAQINAEQSMRSEYDVR